MHRRGIKIPRTVNHEHRHANARGCFYRADPSTVKLACASALRSPRSTRSPIRIRGARSRAIVRRSENVSAANRRNVCAFGCSLERDGGPKRVTDQRDG